MSDAGYEKGAGIIEAAVSGFAAELGRQIEAQRKAANLSTEMFAGILTMAGIPVQAEDVERLEAGQGPEPDLKLLTALAFTLELSTDKVIFACLQQTGGDASSG
ncbi:MAG: hypothetical protein V4671_32070 [Armatimonadota bacterium]